jgi:hypothetical protein
MTPETWAVGALSGEFDERASRREPGSPLRTIRAMAAQTDLHLSARELLGSDDALPSARVRQKPEEPSVGECVDRNHR